MVYDMTAADAPAARFFDRDGEPVPFVRWYDSRAGVVVRYLTDDRGQVVRDDTGHPVPVTEDRRLRVELVPEDDG